MGGCISLPTDKHPTDEVVMAKVSSREKVASLPSFYPEDVEKIRDREYPLLKDTTYLDHGGTTLYAASLIETFSREMTSNLFGNPHSESASSQLAGRRVDDARLKALRFFNADPDEFDLVFVANATAGIKLVADALRDSDPAGTGFWYGYHMDSHTSLAGVRQLAERGRRCFAQDNEVEEWMASLSKQDEENDSSGPVLFAYPGQSNMTGRRLPRSWCGQLRRHATLAGRDDVFSLFDAASLVSTAPLDLGNPETAPDFTALSFYKIFGFPDLGALIVRKAAGHLFEKRKYFGGGTVGMVINFGQEWHARKDTSIHDHLEDGTLPFHSIIALGCAIDVHERLYGSMENISRHTSVLAKVLYDRLSSLRHANGQSVCDIYMNSTSRYGDRSTQGPLMSFNLKDRYGNWVGKSDVEKLAAVKDVQIRSGGLCNPGGTAYHLDLTDVEMRRNYAEGVRCGNDLDIIGGKPTGQIRVSLGAMTSMRDIDTFIQVIDEFYVDKSAPEGPRLDVSIDLSSLAVSPPSRFYVDRLCVYPIKSCGAFVIPGNRSWEIKPEGLAWDREWCLIHQGTGSALNQKRYPRMALIHPSIDLDRGVLRISRGALESAQESVEVPLFPGDEEIMSTQMCQNSVQKSSTVCGDRVTVHAYSDPAVSDFFSSFLDVPCTLARFPAQSSNRYSRDWEPLKQRQQEEIVPQEAMPGAFPDRTGSQPGKTRLLLSNESPMLLISRSSVNKLNELIKSNSGTSNPGGRAPKAVAADVFRANIVVAEDNRQGNPVLPASYSSPTPPTLSPYSRLSSSLSHPAIENPYVEDTWSAFHIGNHKFDVLGPCQRCQMVCIDQRTGVRGDEPFSTLSKTRKVDGKVLFGRHVCLSDETHGAGESSSGTPTAGSSSPGTSCGGGSETGSHDGGGVWIKAGDAITPIH